MASGFVQLLMMNRKLKKIVPLLALGCCAFGLAACGASDLADYAPPVLAAPTRKCVLDYDSDTGDLTSAHVNILMPSVLYDSDNYLLTGNWSFTGVVEDSDNLDDPTGSNGEKWDIYVEYADPDLTLNFGVATSTTLVEMPDVVGGFNVNISNGTTSTYLRFVLDGFTWVDWNNEYLVFSPFYDTGEGEYIYLLDYSYTPVNAPDNVVGGVVEILTGGITGLGQGIASGVNTFINSLAFFGDGLSPFFIMTIVFGALSLAVGLTTLVYTWLTDLGGSK